MKYIIDHLKTLLNLLPVKLRKARMINLIYALIKGLRNLYEDFALFVLKIKLEIGKNGQVIVLEKLLNDAFDYSLRRIWIGDSVAFDSPSVFLITENQVNAKVYKTTEIPPGTGLQVLKSSELSSSINFIVWIPVALQGTINLNHLKGILNTYKYAGMRYTIKYF